ncbi:hypothetical protein [Catenovulum sediminis]|uniref:DUF3078 domain-containing protein n=1 Tax=Catenovulum sediminis TaxID=1740262 RepID=A0ABV1RFR7_9ALTE|nr:hypothetical protein [Catenovulum sediminis]
MIAKKIIYLSGLVLSLQVNAQTLPKQKLAVTFEHQQNLFNSAEKYQAISEQNINLEYQVAQHWQLSPAQRTHISLSGQLQKYQEFTFLDKKTLQLAAWYAWQNDFHYLSPFYLVAVKLAKNELEDEARNSQQLQLTALYQQRINDRLKIQTGLSHQITDAHNKVFERRISQFFSHLKYVPNSKILYRLGLQIGWGKLGSSKYKNYCQYPAHESLYQNNATYWYDTQLNYYDKKDNCKTWYSYQFDGRFTALTAATELQIHESLSAAIQYKKQWTRVVNSSISYQQQQLTAELNYRF